MIMIKFANFYINLLYLFKEPGWLLKLLDFLWECNDFWLFIDIIHLNREYKKFNKKLAV